MPASRLARLSERPGVLGVVLLVATLVLAGALGLEATRSAASHRAAVERTLHDYAAIAAWQYARQGRIWLGFGMNEASAMIERALSTERGPLPGPSLLHRVLAEKECDCMSAGFARTVFRAGYSGEPDLVVEGEPLSATARTTLARLILADSVPKQGPRRWRILPPGEPDLRRSDDVILLWKVGPEQAGQPGVRAVYGMVVEVGQIHRPLTGAVTDTEILPPSLVQGARTDSVFRLAVTGPNRTLILETSPPAPAYAGADTLGWLYGNLSVTAEIRPQATALLVAGGLPTARSGQMLALVVVTLGVGAASLLLLRREHQLVRLRDDFVSGVSHELRTPLTQIRMLTELLQQDGFRSAAERTRAMDVIHRETLRLTNLVDNVLQFARLRRRPETGAAAPVPLGSVVEEVRDAFQPMLQSAGSRLAVDYPDGLLIPGERDAVTRILRNLLENAVKYGPAGQTVRLSGGMAGPMVRLTVEDQGPGIPAEDRSRIWRPYQRLERDRNAPVGGSGLGLSVVAELTAAMGGQVWVEDATGGGARFVVELPRAGSIGAGTS